MRAIELRLAAVERRIYGRSNRVTDTQKKALELSMKALMDGCGLDPLQELRQLRVRLDAGLLTDADTRLLDGLPTCYMSPAEIVRRMDDVQELF